ncbi:ThuA domain-containing protein [Flavobacteriaceae bacterium R33]|uniref:ThuA domain-containing protein n=2 Tax=Poritiphilus flavus TaxID=2697053 RepID=A0A6L9EFH6_9FLAO|nr:ThuA domain-containing protein [Poritiphilus flavus]
MFLFSFVLSAQNLKPIELNEDWLNKISDLVPETAKEPGSAEKQILIFSLHTGYEHWTIPHTAAVMEILVDKIESYNSVTSFDIQEFQMENLKKYDAVILNNNCSKRDKRNLFWDVLSQNKSLSKEQAEKQANAMENNLLEYVRSGGGLIVLHGGITMQNKSDAFSELVGGSFDYHPKQQNIKVELVDADHPLLSAFEGKGFEHIDEPYFFNNAYFDYDFRPLLYMDANSLTDLREPVEDNIKYISWIKRYGNGRVFYSSLSHNAQSYDNSGLLKFLSDGMRYAAGELACDDAPMGKP